MESDRVELKVPFLNLFRDSRWLGDSFLLIQIFAAIWFGYVQVGALLVSVEGVSITWMGFWLAFVIINLGLAVGASKKETGRVIRQTIGTYMAWTFVLGLAFSTLIAQGASWTKIDTVTALITSLGAAFLFIYARLIGLAIFDPIIRGGLALLFRFVPQITLAINVWMYGGKGIALYTILVGHFVITTRIGQIWISARRTGWDKHRVGMVVGEVGNEVSWIIVTLVWFSVVG